MSETQNSPSLGGRTTKKQLIVYLLDRSGSMAAVQRETEDGFRAYQSKMRSAAPNAALTLVTFDDQSIDHICNARPITDPLEIHFNPRGGTPLYDAIGQTIERAQEFLAQPEWHDSDVAFVIHTDGQENSSRTWTAAHVREKIAEVEGTGWAVSYMGANVDAFSESAQIGISVGNTSNYAPQHTARAFAVNADAHADFFAGRVSRRALYAHSDLKSLVDDDSNDQSSTFNTTNFTSGSPTWQTTTPTDESDDE